MSSPALTPTAPSPSAQPPLLLRAFRGTLIAALSLLSTLLLALTLAAWLPMVRASLKPLFSTYPAASFIATGLVVLLLLALPLLVLVRGVRRGWLTWPSLAGLAALALAACIYLMWDDPIIRRPLSIDEIAPALPGDEKSFDLLMRYGKGSPAALAFKTPPSPVGGTGPRDPAKWKAHLLAQRTAIEAGWAQLAPVHAWWLELAAGERIGDLTPPRFDAQIMAFAPVRSYSQHAAAIASLQALDGHGDAALATLRTLFDVARKLEPGARTLVRAMIAKVIQRLALETAAFVLDQTPVSAVARAEFAATLAAAQGGPAGARRLVLIEYALFAPLLLSTPLSDLTSELDFPHRRSVRVLDLLGRLLVNRRATFNLLGERYYALATLAESRRLAQLESAKAEVNGEFAARYHVKNLGGRLLADAAMPVFNKVVKSYWEIEDLRVALLARLKS